MIGSDVVAPSVDVERTPHPTKRRPPNNPTRISFTFFLSAGERRSAGRLFHPFVNSQIHEGERDGKVSSRRAPRCRSLSGRPDRSAQKGARDGRVFRVPTLTRRPRASPIVAVGSSPRPGGAHAV